MKRDMYPRLGQSGGWFSRFSAFCSQLINLVFFNGSPDETVSGRCYRQGTLQGMGRWDKGRKVINTIFFWELNHCYKSHLQDLNAAESLKSIYESTKNKVTKD